MQEAGGSDSARNLNSISLGSGATQTLVPTDWDNLGGAPINLAIDQYSNGKSVSTILANAVY